MIGIAGLMLAALAYAVAWRRYRRAHLALTAAARLPDAGVVIAIVGAATLVLALAALVVVIVFRPALSARLRPQTPATRIASTFSNDSSQPTRVCSMNSGVNGPWSIVSRVWSASISSSQTRR